MNSSDITAIVGLIVAVVALIVSAAQLVLSYIFSKTARSKVSSAAIGSWSKLNRGPYTWSFLIWPFRPVRIRYVQPVLDVGDVVAAVGAFDLAVAARVRRSLPRNVQPAVSISATESARGLTITERNIKVYDQHGHDVTAQFTRQLNDANAILNRTHPSSRLRTKATWHNMMSDLVVDTSFLHPKPSSYVYVDADTIPSHLDAPVLYINASTLIICGFLLDMELTPNVDRRRDTFDMVGEFSTMNFLYAAGSTTPVVSYENRPGYDHTIRLLTKTEVSTTVNIARGRLSFASVLGSFADLGFNAVAYFLRFSIEWLGTHRSWRCDRLPDEGTDHMSSFEPDHHRKWRGHWQTPQTPFEPFFLSIAVNVAVANAFPRELLENWTHTMRHACSKSAYTVIDGSVAFEVSPPDLIDSIMSWKGTSGGQASPYIMSPDGYKVTSNYGCQSGGERGWLCSSHSEFTWRLSNYWPAPLASSSNVVTGFRSVPILFQLVNHLRDGTLNVWAERYAQEPDKGKHWQTTVHNILWLQTTILDSWLARHAEIVMGGSGTDVPEEDGVPTVTLRIDPSPPDDAASGHSHSRDNVPLQDIGIGPTHPVDSHDSPSNPLPPPDEECVPVAPATADAARKRAANAIESMGWKRSRSKLALQYLTRLADGVEIPVADAPDSEVPPADLHRRIAPGCMARDGAVPTSRNWEGMENGTPEQWMVLDAVLSLRAVLMAQRFESMKDSSILLKFRSRDPFLQMI